MKLTLPYPPSTNHGAYWGQVGHRRYLTPRALKFRNDVLIECISKYGIADYFDKPVSMIVDLYPPDRRKRDADNGIKALWDALQHAGALADDSLVKAYTVTMRDIVKGGQCVVQIYPI